MALWRVFTALKSRRSYHVFITSAPSPRVPLTLRQPSMYSYLNENKLAEACASRTHRRHQGCRPPVLKTGRITGPHALPSLLVYAICGVHYQRGAAGSVVYGGRAAPIRAKILR